MISPLNTSFYLHSAQVKHAFYYRLSIRWAAQSFLLLRKKLMKTLSMKSVSSVEIKKEEKEKERYRVSFKQELSG